MSIWLWMMNNTMREHLMMHWMRRTSRILTIRMMFLNMMKSNSRRTWLSLKETMPRSVLLIILVRRSNRTRFLFWIKRSLLSWLATVWYLHWLVSCFLPLWHGLYFHVAWMATKREELGNVKMVAVPMRIGVAEADNAEDTKESNLTMSKSKMMKLLLPEIVWELDEVCKI